MYNNDEELDRNNIYWDSKEELDIVRNNRYDKILKNMKKEILVNEIKEFDNLKVKWSRIPENNILPQN